MPDPTKLISKTLKPEPTLLKPYTESAEPMREKHLTDTPDPTCMLSRILNEDENLAIP
jgi:hypothetical protein